MREVEGVPPRGWAGAGRKNCERAWFLPPKAAKERAIFPSVIFLAGENRTFPRGPAPRGEKGKHEQ